MKVKKLLAGVLAGTLVLGSLAVVSADTSSSIENTVAFEHNTGTEALSGDFDVTYTGSEIGGEFANAPLVELRDAENNCIDFRFDNWGWTYTTVAGQVDFTDEQKAITLFPTDGWEGIAEQRALGMTFEANVIREGDTFTATFTEYTAEGEAYVTWTYTVEFAMKTDTTITLTTGGAATLTDIVFTDNNTSDDGSDVENDGTDADDDDADNEEELNAADYNTVVDEYTLEDQYCDGWWTTFSQAIELVEGTKTVITGVTTNCSTFNWNNIIYVLYSSDDGNVYPADSDEAIATNYTEYFVGRADNWGWGVVDFTVLSAPEDEDAWLAWLAATQAGAEFTIEALYVDGTVQITITCLDASYVITYAVEDPDTPIYLALTGEDCQLSDLSVVVYEASEDEIVDVDELISETDETVDDDDAAAAVSGVKTADASLLLLIVLALAGCSAIAFVAKKRA